ncbi:MAG: hypothetical protein KBF88_04005 [Polyangiaceae bacterium]|nr:hypothetical protein [Polyangiaceae bacterium]
MLVRLQFLIPSTFVAAIALVVACSSSSNQSDLEKQVETQTEAEKAAEAYVDPANCLTCADYQDSANRTRPLCKKNGTPSSEAIAIAFNNCFCTTGCKTECNNTCTNKAAADNTCALCVQTKCNAEFKACLDDRRVEDSGGIPVPPPVDAGAEGGG